MTMQTLAKSAEAGHLPAKIALGETAAFFGIDLKNAILEEHLPDIEAALFKEQIEKRLALLADKNWAEADKIRDELTATGIQLMDFKDPETGEKRTKWEIKR